MGAYSAAVVADGASHYWRLGEASGAVAADSAGSAPGTISGGVTLGQPGPLADGATAMGFDGTSGKITIAGTLAVPVPATFECWGLLPGPDLAVHPALTNQAVGAGDGPLLLAIFNGVATVNVQGGSNASGVVRVDGSTWRHLVAVSDAAAIRVYVDGVLDNGVQAVGRAGASAHPGAIGWNPSAAGVFWKGSIAEVAVYPLALTPAQIANHYALRTATGGGGGAAFPWPLALVVGDTP
jgi:hypothetical protein